MIIYNVTTKVTSNIADEWLQWVQREHIPEITSTGCFTSASILRLLDVDDDEGPTYAIQYFAESKELYETYLADFADILRKKSFDRWGNQFISFRSVMEIVQ